MKIKILKTIAYLNDMCTDLLVCFFLILSTYELLIDKLLIQTTSKVVFIILPVYFGIHIIHITIKGYQRFPHVSFSKLFIFTICMYGLIENGKDKRIYITYLVVTFVINTLIKEFVRLGIEKYYFEISNKGALYHELGHYIMCKEYGVHVPREINFYKDNDYVQGNFISTGDLEKLEPFKHIVELLAGYVTEKYILYGRKEYEENELQRALIPELSFRTYSLEYTHELTSIYLERKKLQEATHIIIDVLQREKDYIIAFAKQNKYKRKIIFKDQIN